MLDFEEKKGFLRFRLNPAKLFIAIGSVCALVLGYTFAGNINLNNDQAVEFGQGVVQTVACDQDGIELTPYSAFINGDSNFAPITLTANSSGLESGRLLYTNDSLSSVKVGDSVQGLGIPSGSFITNISSGFFAISNSYSAEITSSSFTIFRPPGRFLLSAIEIADIDSRVNKCVNKSFTIKVYNSTSSSPMATYEVFDTGSEFTSGSGEIENDFANVEKASGYLIIDEPTVAATDVYRITIESKDQINLALSRIGIWAGSAFCGDLSEEECSIPTSSSNSEYYCSESEGLCNIVFMPAYNFLQLLIEIQCGLESQCDEALSSLSSSTWTLSKNNSQDPDMDWQIVISQPGTFGPFENTLHLSGQILYSNGEYAVFRWFGNTAGNPPIEARTYIDLIISFNDSLPITRPYAGDYGSPFDVSLYQMTWNF